VCRVFFSAHFFHSVLSGSIVSTVKKVIFDVVPGVVKTVINSAMQCVEGGIKSCFLNVILDVLKWYLLFVYDLVDTLVKQMYRIHKKAQSIVSLAACMSCSLTTIAVGVLSDFTRDFSLDACHTIVDVARDGCSLAGVPSGPVGAGIFDGVWGVMKLMIGLAKHAVPIAEMTWAIVQILLDAAIDLFPDLVADGADLLAFALTMSDAGVKLVVMYEALLDPMFDDISDVIASDMHNGIGTRVDANATHVPSPFESNTCPGYIDPDTPCSVGNATKVKSVVRKTRRCPRGIRRDCTRVVAS